MGRTEVLAGRELSDPREIKENRGPGESMAGEAGLADTASSELQVLLDRKDTQDHLEPRETLDSKVFRGYKDRQVDKVSEEVKGPRVRSDLWELVVSQECGGRPASRDRKATGGAEVVKGRRDREAPRAPRESRAGWERRGNRGLEESRD